MKSYTHSTTWKNHLTTSSVHSLAAYCCQHYQFLVIMRNHFITKSCYKKFTHMSFKWEKDTASAYRDDTVAYISYKKWKLQFYMVCSTFISCFTTLFCAPIRNYKWIWCHKNVLHTTKLVCCFYKKSFLLKRNECTVITIKVYHYDMKLSCYNIKRMS